MTSAPSTEINADFPKALQCLFEPRRYKVLYGGRGAGRSWGVARALLLLGLKRPIRVLCARELQKSIEDSVYRILCDQIGLMGLDKFYRILSTSIEGFNGTSFIFEGVRNNINKVKSLEGIDYCWVEEAVKVSETSWGVLIPTIRKEGSEIWVTFNPEKEDDYTYQRFAKDPALKQVGKRRWEASHSIVSFMTWEDNEWFPQVLRDELERDRARDLDYYLHVWEGHCLQNLQGAVYANELRKVLAEGRICDVPYERSMPVDAFFDLGRADNTACWFVQRVAMQWRILGYCEESGKDWSYFLKLLQRQRYIYDTIHLPFDAKAKRLGTKLTIEELTRQAGFRVAIVPKLSKNDGINAARIVFPNCWFDEIECERGVKALRNYRYRVVEGQLSNEPLHDWASDGADAFRYFAVSAKLPRSPSDVQSKLQRTKSRLSELGRSATLGWMQ